MKQVGLGIIGAGLIGDLHALVYSRLPGAKLVAVCDVDEGRASDMAKKYAVKHVYSDYRELLANPDIDAVSIVTPDFAHRDIAVASAQAGKHILVEKPLATTLEDAQAIAAAVKKSGVKLMVDFQNRCNPPFVNAKERIVQGEIGKPTYVYARLSNTTFVATKMLRWAAQSSVLWFLGSHTLDLACWLLNDEPKRVFAVSRSGILQAKGIDTPDFYITTIEFKNGGVATLENAWILPESEPSVFNFKLEVLGEKGSIYTNTSDHRAAQVYGTKEVLPDMLGIVPTSPYRIGGFMLEAVAQFIDTLLYDRPLLATVEDGLRVTKVLAAVEESTRRGQPVDV
jgi:predicted dehydrogenase